LETIQKTFSWFKGTIFYNMQLDHILVLKILDMWSEKIPELLICNILLVKPKLVSTVLKKIIEREAIKEIFNKFR
jgi:hypothetical protein